jgi:hypothetical protein
MREKSKNNKYLKLTQNIKTGFTIPEGYFNSIENVFFSNSIEKCLPKKDGFNTPENYFNKLDNQILIKLRNSKKGKLIKIKMLQLVPIAATIAIFLFIGINFVYTENSELSSDEITNWFETNINTISYDDITAFYGDANFDDIELLEHIINEDIIKTYIIANGIDIPMQDMNVIEID